MKKPLAAAAFVLASATAAQAINYIPAQTVIKNPDAFPVCHTKSGLPVKYIFEFSVLWGAASSFIDKGQAYISFTPHFERFSAKEQVLNAEHECAHHRLGHTELNILAMSPAERIEKENDAECEAASEVKRKYAYTRADLIAGMAWVAQKPQTQFHPSGAQRMANALKCFDAAP